MVRKILSTICILFACWGAARFSHHQTEGFRLTKLTKNASPLADQTAPEHKEEIPSLIEGRYSYLGRGIQSFAFVSEDGEHVLKLFNNRYQNRLFWLGLMPAKGPWKRWRSRRIDYNGKKLENTFRSYEIAYEHLKEEAGLLHWAPHGHHKPLLVTLVDRLGIAHKIDLEHTAFAVQKKVHHVYPFLRECTDDAVARRAIHDLVSLLRKKMEMGIADRDPLIRTNFGFYGETPIQIDIGPLSFDPSLVCTQKQKEELEKITLSFRHWLEAHEQGYLPYLNEALNTN